MNKPTKITIGKPTVRGVDPQYSGLLNVDVPLNPRPDQHWTQVFNDCPPGVSYSLSMHPPTMQGGTVRLKPPDGEIDAYMLHLRERVAATNTYHEQRIESALRREREAREAEEAERRRRVDEARRRLDELDGQPYPRTPA